MFTHFHTLRAVRGLKNSTRLICRTVTATGKHLGVNPALTNALRLNGTLHSQLKYKYLPSSFIVSWNGNTMTLSSCDGTELVNGISLDDGSGAVGSVCLRAGLVGLKAHVGGGGFPNERCMIKPLHDHTTPCPTNHPSQLLSSSPSET